MKFRIPDGVGSSAVDGVGSSAVDGDDVGGDVPVVGRVESVRVEDSVVDDAGIGEELPLPVTALSSSWFDPVCPPPNTTPNTIPTIINLAPNKTPQRINSLLRKLFLLSLS